MQVSSSNQHRELRVMFWGLKFLKSQPTPEQNFLTSFWTVYYYAVMLRVTVVSSDEQLDSGLRIDLDSDLSWIHLVLRESWVWIELSIVESCNDESELSLKPIYMNGKWIWIQYLPKRIQEWTQFHAYNPSFLSQRGAHGNSQLDIMKEAVARSFYISMSIVQHSKKSDSLYSQVCVRDFGSRPSKVT